MTPDAPDHLFSIGLESLMARQDGPQAERAAARPGSFDCDVLIVGSGYGGAVAADALAGLLDGHTGQASRVWVLERGQPYPQGSFPARLSELPGHVRFTTPGGPTAQGVRTGLFDVRLGPDVCTVVASGLGGGSLINAGVMEMPTASVFEQAAWPGALRQEAGQLETRSRDLSARLGAQAMPGGPDRLTKHAALEELARGATASGGRFRSVPITVDWDACQRCGDCATGCNHNAKLSLDKTLLNTARHRGATLVTGASVQRVETLTGGGWRVWIEHTHPLFAAQTDQAFTVRARRVVLAAGTFGSSEILMRSQAYGLALSSRLGERFSTNGDVLAAVHGQASPVNAVADEQDDPAERQVGPTISAMIDVRRAPEQGLGLGHVVQELAIPGPLKRVFAELFTTAKALHDLDRFDLGTHRADDDDPLLLQDQHLRHTQVLAIIGHDSASGQLRPPKAMAWRDPTRGEGLLTVSWPDLREDHRPDQQLADLRRWNQASGAQGQVLPMPLWQPLPASMSALSGDQKGPSVSTHPLGGCAMGESGTQGVVNHLGQVFQGPGEEVYPDLVVLDGSIIPTSLGINPALTISCLAQRAIDRLRVFWRLTEAAPPCQGPVTAPRLYRPPSSLYSATARRKVPTTVEVTEQLHGWVSPQDWMQAAWPADHQLALRLTLRFRPVEALALLRPHPGARTVELDPQHSLLEFALVQGPESRVATAFEWGQVVLSAPLSGQLQFMHREASRPWARAVRGGGAWFVNRGLRDTVLHLLGRDPPSSSAAHLGAWDKAKGLLKLATRAGEVRRFDYALRTGEATAHVEAPWVTQLKEAWQGQTLAGHKRLTYSRRGNPWTQLTSMSLTHHPGQPPWAGANIPLQVNLSYFAEQGVPLLRLLRFDTMPDALVDLGSLLAWVSRVLLHTHLWTFRKPDTPPPRQVHRLPGQVHPLPPPEVIELDMGLPGVRIRLTRYAHPTGRPVLMIHGYSASGTTFAHPAVRPNLAETLRTAGHDVWILDMRTSPGMASASQPWTFEEVAYNDIPQAVDHITRATGHAQIDIVAHCMGSAMLWMALLGDLPTGPDPTDQRPALRAALRHRIHRLVISQVAPKVVFSPANVMRAYLGRYLRQFMPLGRFDFRPEQPTLGDTLLDRLLASQAYPDPEYSVENPFWPPWRETPWTGTRHRMDALYGRDFNALNLSADMLAAIDDHFGPMNLASVSQAIHFARWRCLTNQQGQPVYVTPARMAAAFTFPCLYVHGEENGLSDITGMRLFRDFVDSLGPEYAARLTCLPIPGYGHQDCLVGKHAHHDVFPHITRFLH
ncbi:MAG: alpha/beta fold hydrolase [Rubrivivax sp.]|nr:MAG: alpha/beta fold hydrolase [Rubrivivax sp.]